MMTDVELAEAGKAAVVEGLRLWHLDIGDPAPQFLADPHPGANEKWLELHARALRWRVTIDEILKSAGWGASTPYKGNHHAQSPEWCGLFAAACWRAAGLDPKWLAPFFASTVRLYNWAHYKPFNQHANPPPQEGAQRRLVAKLGSGSTVADLPFAVREGDIVIIGGPHDESVGRHITIARGPVDAARGVVHTVEGNGWGNGPDGKPREGIVVGERKIGGVGDHVMWIYRPAPSDLEAAVG